MSAGGGIGGSGIISTGTVAEIGSIVVNGTRFDTVNAELIVNGESVGTGNAVIRANLDIGRVVTVEGPDIEDNNTASAHRVIYRDNVQGPVESVNSLDSNTQEIVVMGQTVIVNSLTRLKGLFFDGIAVNDTVEVSGFFDDVAIIWATFIEKTGTFRGGAIFEVTGLVIDLDSVAQTFKINDLTVDYSQADTEALPDGMPVEGLRVEAIGTLGSGGGTLIASTIVLETDLETDNADEIEVTGFITRFNATTQFTIGTQAVTVETDAEIVDGELAEIGPGIKLSAERTLIDGVLFAYEIEFWEPDQIEVEGIVTDIVSSTEFTVDNQVVITTDETEFEDINPEDLVLGITIEIKGRLRNGVLVADKVSFEED